MGYGIETVIGTYTATATTGAQAYTAITGSTFQVRASNPNSSIYVHSLWSQSSATGYTRLRSSRMHDDVIGFEVAHLTNNVSPLALGCVNQEVYAQDTLTVEDYWQVAPGAVQQSVAYQVYYDDLAGIAANYWTWAQVQTAAAAATPQNQVYGVVVRPSSSATAGQFGTGVALNSYQDTFRANSWYALIGYITNTRFTAFTILGTDLGNLYVGGPGSVDPLITRRYFADMEYYTGKPSIPVINSQNKGATYVYISDNATSTQEDLSLLFVYCGPTGA